MGRVVIPGGSPSQEGDSRPTGQEQGPARQEQKLLVSGNLGMVNLRRTYTA